MLDGVLDIFFLLFAILLGGGTLVYFGYKISTAFPFRFFESFAGYATTFLGGFFVFI